MSSSTTAAGGNSPAAPVWVDGLTIGQVLAKIVQHHAAADALVFPALDLRYSYAAFDRAVYETAKGLLSLGIRRGDHVALWATNVPQWVLLQFATARIGAVLVTINPAYRPFELKYVLKQSDAVALFLIDRFKTSDYHAMLHEVCPELSSSSPGALTSAEYPRLKSVINLQGPTLAGALSWSELLDRGRNVDSGDLAQAESQCRPGDVINIQYTSGTTGFPKAAMLTHRNLLLNAYYIGDCQQLGPTDRICIPVPFYHCFGCVLGTLCAVVRGAAMVIPAESFQPTATLEAIEKERATSIYGVPTMFIAQLQDATFDGRDLRSLRTGIMAGSPCPVEIMRQVIERMGARQMTIAYGLTEASPVITQTRTEDPLELRVETVGRPIPDLEVKVVDPLTGQPLPDNQPGELCTRGHGVMKGYYRDPVATAAAIDSDGWLHTGDIATRLANGYYKITGRIKDMVIRGGENIYPREIEEFLFTHPAVEQASLVGVPDDKYGEELCAWIRLKQGQAVSEEEIRRYCKQNLAHYKVPRYIRFVDAFPQTVTGKIQKFKMREQMMQELNLKEQRTA